MADATTGSDLTHVEPFRESALTYYRKGWTDVFPTGSRGGPRFAKSPIPEGVTGYDGKPVGWKRIKATTESPAGRRNIAARMPRHVVCLDVDEYGDHHGLATLATAEKEWGALPDTYRNSARGFQVSGHRYFRLPLGLTLRQGAEKLLTDMGGNIEILDHFHRYAVVWPSRNPEHGYAMYRWYAPDGAELDEPPAVVELPLLPQGWVDHLCVAVDSPQAARHGGNLRAPRGASTAELGDFDDAKQAWRRSVMERKALEHARAVRGMGIGSINTTLGAAGIAYGRYAEAGLFTLDEARLILEAAARRNGLHSDEWNRRNRKKWTLSSRLDDALSQGINHSTPLEIIEDVPPVNVFEQVMREIDR